MIYFISDISYFFETNRHV